MADDATSLPSLNPFRRLVITPWEYRCMMSSLRYWEWIPRSFFSDSPWMVAWDMASSPIWSVEPSSISRAMSSPMRTAVSDGGRTPTVRISSSCSTTMSTSLTWMKLWPSTRGSRGFTWAITRSADMAAARVTSTDIPRLIQPKSSGGVVWIMATWIGSFFDVNRSGTSDMFIGVMNRLWRAMGSAWADPR